MNHWLEGPPNQQFVKNKKFDAYIFAGWNIAL